MHFDYQGGNANLSAAVGFANTEAFARELWERITERKTHFYNTTLSVAEILQRLKACSTTIRVEHWTPTGLNAARYRSTPALTSTDRPFAIRYHTRFLSNSSARMVNTIAHEFIHNVDYHWDRDLRADYTHRGQRPGGANEESAPYWIGNVAQELWERSQAMTLAARSELVVDYAAEWDFECPDVVDAEDACD
jgi:hypothetical protein